MSDWTWDYSDSQTQQSLVTEIFSGITSLISHTRLETRHSPVKENGLNLSYGVIEGLWRWLMIWGLKHPRTLVCVGMATAKVRLAWTWMRTHHLIYVGIVVVARPVNLWCNHTTACFAERPSTLCGELFLTTEPYKSKMSKLKLWFDIWYYVGVAWFISGA